MYISVQSKTSILLDWRFLLLQLTAVSSYLYYVDRQKFIGVANCYFLKRGYVKYYINEILQGFDLKT